MKNRKNEQREKLGKNGSLHRSEGHPRHSVALRRGETEGPERPPLGFAKA